MARKYPPLSTQLTPFVQQTEQRMLAVLRQSISDLLDDASLPKARGGNMPVDTAFLRNSLAATVNDGMPSGDGVNPAKGKARVPASVEGSAINNNIITALTMMKLGDTLFIGWLANYAKYQEAYNGFMENALMKWQNFVDANCIKLKDRIENDNNN